MIELVKSKNIPNTPSLDVVTCELTNKATKDLDLQAGTIGEEDDESNLCLCQGA